MKKTNVSEGAHQIRLSNEIQIEILLTIKLSLISSMT